MKTEERISKAMGKSAGALLRMAMNIENGAVTDDDVTETGGVIDDLRDVLELMHQEREG